MQDLKSFVVVVVVVIFRMYVALVVFQPYCDLKSGDNQSLKS